MINQTLSIKRNNKPVGRDPQGNILYKGIVYRPEIKNLYLIYGKNLASGAVSLTGYFEIVKLADEVVAVNSGGLTPCGKKDDMILAKEDINRQDPILEYPDLFVKLKNHLIDELQEYTDRFADSIRKAFENSKESAFYVSKCGDGGDYK